MRKGIGGHHSARAGSEVWLTPQYVIDALGGPMSFDLDPCASIGQPWPTARKHYTKHDNGLILPWAGRVWLNPPYTRGLISKFMGRMAAHGNGVAFTFARTETAFFHKHVWPVADAILFCEGRITFHRPDGSEPQWDGGAPSVLIAYGGENVDALAGSGLAGAFVPLRWKAFVQGFAAVGTWMEELIAIMRRIGEAASLSDIYRSMATHPKAKRNPNYQAKIRQTLQTGPFERVQSGVWKLI